MRELISSTLTFVYPVLRSTPLAHWLEFFDDNLLVAGSGIALLASLVLWANI